MLKYKSKCTKIATYNLKTIINVGSLLSLFFVGFVSIFYIQLINDFHKLNYYYYYYYYQTIKNRILIYY